MSTKPILSCVALCACLLAATGCLPDPEVRTTLVIVGGEYIEAEGANPVRDAVILIEGDSIASFGPQAHVRFPKGVNKVDARGKWILPGRVNDEGFTVFPEATAPGKRVKADLLIFPGNPLSAGYGGAPPVFVIESGRVTMQSAPETPQP